MLRYLWNTHYISCREKYMYAGRNLALKLNISISPNANVVTCSGASSLWSYTGSTLCQVLLLQVLAQLMPGNVSLWSLESWKMRMRKSGSAVSKGWAVCSGFCFELTGKRSVKKATQSFSVEVPKRRFLMCWRYSEICLFPKVSPWFQPSNKPFWLHPPIIHPPASQLCQLYQSGKFHSWT